MSNNRLWNVRNPNQGAAKRVLCVCSAGLLRSPTAANVLNQKYGYNTRSAGCSTDHALIPVDNVLLSWADEIVCMNTKQRELLFALMKEFQIQSDTPIVVLDIPDIYAYGDPELRKLIETRYAESLECES